MEGSHRALALPLALGRRRDKRRYDRPRYGGGRRARQPRHHTERALGGGGIRLGLAAQCDDSSLMSTAFSEASALVANDPGLTDHPALLKSIEKMFTAEAGTMN